MEILSKLNGVLLSIPTGDGNPSRLGKIFRDATRDSDGMMNLAKFKSVILYPIKEGIIERIFTRLFDKKQQGFITERDFLAASSDLERKIRSQRFDELMAFYSDHDQMITFDDFKCLLNIAILQMSFCFHNDEIEKIAVVIVKKKEYRYPVSYIMTQLKESQMINAFSDIFLTRLFLSPSKQLTNPLERRPMVKIKQSSKRFLALTFAIYLLLIFTVIYSLALHRDDRQIHSLNALDQYWQSVVRLHRSERSKSLPHVYDVTNVGPHLDWMAIWRNISTELVNVNFTLIVIVTLKSFQIVVRKPPLCGYAFTQDIRTIWWSIVVLTGCSLLSETLSKCVETLEIPMEYLIFGERSHLLLRNDDDEMVAAILKLSLFGIFFSVRMFAARRTSLPFAKDITDIVLCAVMMIHVVQEVSFLKWTLVILFFAAVEYYVTRFDGRYFNVIPILSCTTLEEQNIVTVRNEFSICLPGDFILVSFDTFAVHSAVPAWVIESPQNRAYLRLRLQSGDWQTEILRKHVHSLKDSIMKEEHFESPEVFRKGLKRVGSSRYGARGTYRVAGGRELEKDQPQSPGIELRARASNKKRIQTTAEKEQIIVLFNRDIEEESNLERLIDCSESLVVESKSRISAKLYGPFRGVCFEEYSSYESILLLVTPSSAGAVASYLHAQSHVKLARRKVYLVFAVKKVCGVEWFMKLLVQLEIEESKRHQQHHKKEKRSECSMCKLFFKIFLLRQNRGDNTHNSCILLKLALRILAGEDSDQISALLKSISIEECRIHEEASLLKNVQFILGDTEFPKIAKISSQAATQGIHMEMRSF